ncbi:MAG TPA: type II toxin-antitoxin system VapC family toxin [Candidatus Lokiarchaeia archaeon]|nr:type II toxin-antitoxin system VapC family toxin [Candidatus Lokiarchaeia archaeon]
MAQSICLDTRPLSRFLNGNKTTSDLLDDLRDQSHDFYTTVVNVTEVYMGLRKLGVVSDQKKNDLSGFFSNLHPRPLDYEASIKAGELSGDALHGRGIGWRDTFIAAIVLLNGSTILTSNAKHFERIPGLNVMEFT